MSLQLFGISTFVAMSSVPVLMTLQTAAVVLALSFWNAVGTIPLMFSEIRLEMLMYAAD